MTHLLTLATTLPEPLRWPWVHGIEWMWWPPTGHGYAFFSSVAGATGFFALILYWRHVECHEKGCHRRGKYVIEGGVRCCDLHHPALDERPHSERGHVHALHIAHLDLLHDHAHQPSYRPKGIHVTDPNPQ